MLRAFLTRQGTDWPCTVMQGSHRGQGGSGSTGGFGSSARKELCTSAVDPRPHGFSQEVMGYFSREVVRSSPDEHLLGDV